MLEPNVTASTTGCWSLYLAQTMYRAAKSYVADTPCIDGCARFMLRIYQLYSIYLQVQFLGVFKIYSLSPASRSTILHSSLYNLFKNQHKPLINNGLSY